MIVKTGYHIAAKKAAHIIADSLNTARDVELLLDATAEKITAVPIAADRSATSQSSAKVKLAILRGKVRCDRPICDGCECT